MGIFSLNNGKGNGKLVLVFDIGSSSVGGALFWKDKSGIPKIVTALREPITLEENIDADRFYSLSMQTLDTVAGKIFKAGLGAPTGIFCVLSSPWHISQTRIISLKKNSPFTFTAKLADELIKKEVSIFEEEQLSKYTRSGSSVRLIELKNIKMELNGYETPMPLNQKTTELEMTVFLSIAPEQVCKKIEETVKKHFHFKNIQFSSFELATFTVVRDMYEKSNNFLLLDIGGEVTNISMIKRNILQASSSFPLGRNYIIRGVASALGSTLVEARSFISLIKDGHASESVAKKLAGVMDKLSTEWLTKFQGSLANISSDISVPAVIYMTVDSDLADFFSHTIMTEQFNQYTLTESKFKVIVLGPEVFHGYAGFEESTIRDSRLIVDSIYINRFFK